MQRELEYVYAVYKTGGFSAAAKYLYASQPAVSMAVQRVENELGALLFYRNSLPVRLTETGQLFIQHIERIMESEKTFHNQVNTATNDTETCLRIGCTPMHSTYLIPDILCKVCKQLPETRIEIINDSPQELFRYLKTYKIDVAVSTYSDIELTDFKYIHAFDVYYLLGVSGDVPVNKKLQSYAITGEDVIKGKYASPDCPLVSLSAFRETPFISHLEGTELYEQSRKIISEVHFKPKISLRISDSVMAQEMAIRGCGATIVGHFSVSADSPLLYYRLRTKYDITPFFFILRKDSHFTKEQRLFIEFFQTFMENIKHK